METAPFVVVNGNRTHYFISLYAIQEHNLGTIMFKMETNGQLKTKRLDTCPWHGNFMFNDIVTSIILGMP